MKFQKGDKVTVKLGTGEFEGVESTIHVTKLFTDGVLHGLKIKEAVLFFKEEELSLGWKSDMVLGFVCQEWPEGSGQYELVTVNEHHTAIETLAEMFPEDIYFEATITEV